MAAPVDLTDAMRRALKLIDEQTTDMAVTERHEPAVNYCNPERFELERNALLGCPQLVGYAGELPQPGSFVTKEAMDVPLLLTRAADGKVRAFINICRHRQAPVADGCGIAKRLACPYHAWTYDLEGNVTGMPGQEGFEETRVAAPKLAELPAQEYAGFLWVGLRPGVPIDVEAHLGDLGPELAAWDLGSWHPVGEKRLDADIDWKLALDTFAENYHFATVHTTTFATVALSNVTVFDSYGPHHRLIFPMRAITEDITKPESDWTPINRVAVIYALWPNIVISVTAVNGEIFRIYPGSLAGKSTTFHQNAWRHPLTSDDERANAEAVFEYAHHTVRDEDYVLATKVQRNLATGLQEFLVFGRNEPGVQHRAATLADALRTISRP
jgi:phenylpropionate dioxygenase-like ring-hydroxylating dioxygenase large terminal subunit